MIAVDTNILVYAHRAGVPQHEAAKEAIEEAANSRNGWGIAVPTAAEFFMVVTHPSASGRPSTVDEAAAFLRALEDDGGMRIFLPQQGFPARLLSLAGRIDVAGPRIFDLQIGLVAAEAGATELWSHDRRFVAPPGLRVRDPIGAAG